MSDRARIRWLLGLGVVIILLASLGVSRSWQVENRGKVEQNIPAYTCNNCKIEIKQEKGFLENLISDPVAFFTAALAFLTLVLSGVGAAQVYFLKRADETARRSADAALETALAAKKSAETAQRQLIVSNRTWLKPQLIAFGLDIGRDFGARISFGLRVTNTGNGPSLNSTFHNTCLVSITARSYDDPLEKLDVLYRDMREQGLEKGVVIDPGHTTDVERIYYRSVDIKTIASDALPEGINILLYVIGSVGYTFASDPDTLHQTCFIYQIGPKFEGGQADWFKVGEAQHYEQVNIEVDGSRFRDSWLMD